MSDPTAQVECTRGEQILLVASELSVKKWKIAAAPLSDPSRPRLREVDARDWRGLLKEIESAKARFRLAPETRVVTCYEAGRDGFWLHRALEANGIENLVVDAGSIEVPKRGPGAKTDRLDARRLHAKLVRHVSGDGVWSVVHVPSEEAEDNRRPHRELKQVKSERTRLRNRAWAELALEGIRPLHLLASLRNVERLRRWNGKPLRGRMVAKLTRLRESIEHTNAQIREILAERSARRKDPRTEGDRKAAQLQLLKSVGEETSELLAKEFFWRRFENRRQVGAAAGLTGLPYASGDTCIERGLGKRGNKRVRTAMIELSWCWLRYQPKSALSRWWDERFSEAGKRARKVGIAALARKLLIALWRFLEFGEVPEGAVLKVESARPRASA
jgi:transposase